MYWVYAINIQSDNKENSQKLLFWIVPNIRTERDGDL